MKILKDRTHYFAEDDNGMIISESPVLMEVVMAVAESMYRKDSFYYHKQ